MLLLCFAHRVEVGHADLNQLGDLTHALLGRLLGIEAGRVLGHVGHEALGEGLTQLGGVVDLADAVLHSLSNLLIGHTGGAVQNQRHVDGVADCLDHGLLDVRIARVHTVAGANANGQRGAAGALNELLGLGRISVGALALNRGTVVLLAANLTELSLDGTPMARPASATDLVKAMLSSKDSCEPSIMTEV